MKEIEQLFKNNFVLKISNQIDGLSCHVSDVKLQTFKADHQEESVKFQIQEFGDKKYKQPAHVENPEPGSLAFKNGCYLSPKTGYKNYIGNYRYTTEIIKSVGDLVAVDVYDVTDFDDYFFHYNYDKVGSIILDKYLDVIYSNDYTAKRIFYNIEDANKLLHNFGPCVLAFIEPKEFTEDAQKDIKRVFDLRCKKQKENFVSPEKIVEEKEQFEKAFKILKSEYDKLQAKNPGMGMY